MTGAVAPVLDFIHDIDPAALPEDVVAHARRSLLDLIGVAAAGRLTDNSRIVRDCVARYEGAGRVGARMMFDGRRVSVAGAAMANAATIDAFDAHDGQKETKGHAGSVILPSLLALGDELAPSSGAEFLVRFVLGYELACRAGKALHATVHDYHTSGAWTALAAAGVFARGLGLSRTATWHALGAAEYYGPRSQMMRCIDHPTMVKDGATYGAQVGAMAGLLAEGGFTGAPAVTISDDAAASFWSDLGTRWYMREQYLKPYGVCRWAQPAVKAALMLREGVDPSDIDRIEVRTFHEAVRLAVRRPQTTEEAQYSLPYPVAAAMATGDLLPEVVSGNLNDPAILALVDRIVMSESDAANAAFPAERLAAMTLVMKDGSTRSCDLVSADGDPETPLSDAAVDAKYRALAGATLAPGAIEAIREAALAVDGLDDAAMLTDRLLDPAGEKAFLTVA